METSIAELKSGLQQQPTKPPIQSPSPPMQSPSPQMQPQFQAQMQPQPQAQMQPQPQAQMQQLTQPQIYPTTMQSFAQQQSLPQTGGYPLDVSVYYSKWKDIGVLLLIAMLCFSTPFQDIIVKSFPIFTSSQSSKHVNMTGCLVIASILTSVFTFYKTFVNE